jgi:hypothetical protein
MDELIAEGARQLQEIYDNRTAGDFTFTGVLSEFARAVQRELSVNDDGVATFGPYNAEGSFTYGK